ncbi:terminase ATPase subunit family protein [Jeongeupia chitinilytica]|uniref:Bacteriophage terminase ATPase subunit n=1 Tax=Jeongeupia chitinilytica TaxID=1041641 RepID=A0ABQ3GXF0_9NEIS|nr:terminase ATPase subunit family protein [Jeongeupia chitinilytica]GHD59897.1 bacteriophage terminase ATPase subunit [Jeongeupia chitinilytica]
MTDTILELDPRRQARGLYWQGFRIAEIAALLELPRGTLDSWKQRDRWDDAKPIDRVDYMLEARMTQLIMKESKAGGDYKEIDLLGRQIERIARVRRYSETGSEVDLNPKLAKRNEQPKAKPARNVFSEEQGDLLVEAFKDGLFDYQRNWFESMNQRTRMILKSRQIGATWYFAREALIDAILTGRNQIFLSASKSQAHVFKQYIIQFARESAGVDLSGDPIVLDNGAHLYFLGTNARTAQGYHGNFYFDEFFWTNKFEELNKVASGMALHKQWRKTYFSTPSSLNHEAYPFWSGERFNKRRPKKDQADFNVSPAYLQPGVQCPDKIWRQVVTILDAERGGCDLFDIDELRAYEYSPDEFDNLLMCNFIDDTQSVFTLRLLQACMVDSWDVWTDVKPHANRPFADRAVWLGYDPSLNGDSAGLVVLAPPLVAGGKFRVLEKHQWRGMDFEAQASAIRAITERYRVTYIGIDATGIGQGVYQLVRQFFPAAEQISYSPEVKTRLVLKAYDVISKGRLEFDGTDLAQAFMAIRKTLTASGRQVTYEAGRSDETGHADLAWACMHALSNEPLEGAAAGERIPMEIF